MYIKRNNTGKKEQIKAANIFITEKKYSEQIGNNQKLLNKKTNTVTLVCDLKLEASN